MSLIARTLAKETDQDTKQNQSGHHTTRCRCCAIRLPELRDQSCSHPGLFVKEAKSRTPFAFAHHLGVGQAALVVSLGGVMRLPSPGSRLGWEGPRGLSAWGIGLGQLPRHSPGQMPWLRVVLGVCMVGKTQKKSIL